jgi:hypothetical protein
MEIGRDDFCYCSCHQTKARVEEAEEVVAVAVMAVEEAVVVAGEDMKVAEEEAEVEEEMAGNRNKIMCIVIPTLLQFLNLSRRG